MYLYAYVGKTSQRKHSTFQICIHHFHLKVYATSNLSDSPASTDDFEWTDDQPIAFFNWAPDEPDRYGACVRVDESGQWKTTDCSQQYKMASVCKAASVDLTRTGQ